MNSPILEIKNLTVKIKGTQRCLLRDISFNLYESEKLCFFGGSGSGKSLLCKSILGLKAANLDYSGSIQYHQENKIFDLTDVGTLQKVRGKTIALMFQNIFTSLNPMLKVGKQLGLIIKKSNRTDLLKKVGFSTPKKIMNQYSSQLSGGELTRLGLAMAMAQEPKIILLDESFRSIHLELQELFLKQLNSLVTEKNVSLVLVTHNVAVLKKFADRIILMKNGEMIDETTVDQFFKSPNTEYGRRVLKAYNDLYI